MADESNSWSSKELLKKTLENLTKIEKPAKVSVSQIIEKSDKFPKVFPVHHSRLKTLQKVSLIYCPIK